MFHTTITSRRIPIDKGLADYINNGLDRLRFFKNVLDLHIILSKQRSRYSTEIIVNGKGFNLKANETDPGDVHLSIDRAFDKIEGQLKRYKEKKVSRKRRRAIPESMVTVISPRRGEEGFKIGRRKRLDIKPMGIEEAVMQLELSRDEFLVFANAQTQQINVVYKRSSGDYGLIEP